MSLLTERLYPNEDESNETNQERTSRLEHEMTIPAEINQIVDKAELKKEPKVKE